MDLGTFAAGRSPMSKQAALEWVEGALNSGCTPSAGPIPRAVASLAAASAPIRISTNSDTEAGRLAVWLARPINGFHFRCADQLNEIDPVDGWQVSGETHYAAAMDLLGIGWYSHSEGPLPDGLLIGRMERRAWLGRAAPPPGRHFYDVRIGLDPDRVELADLELEVEERVDGELVVAERLRFEDLDLLNVERHLYGGGSHAPPSSSESVTLQLPTLGRKIRRVVRLHHRDGMLLDEWQSFNLVESIGTTLVVNGSRQSTTWSGSRRAASDLVELLGAVERIRSQYSQMRREGLGMRLFDDSGGWRDTLRALLERSPEPVYVLDPYLRDWDLVSGLGLQTKVLIGSRAGAPPLTFDGQAKRWRDNDPVAPFHDRFFLWEGGGVAVGTSAGNPSTRLFRIARLGFIEASELRDRFVLWWSDPGFDRIA